MALSAYMMRRIIKENGHLVLDGRESEKELREALLYLFDHKRQDCRKHGVHMVDEMIPDIGVLAPGSEYRHPHKPRPPRRKVE